MKLDSNRTTARPWWSVTFKRFEARNSGRSGEPRWKVEAASVCAIDHTTINALHYAPGNPNRRVRAFPLRTPAVSESENARFGAEDFAYALWIELPEFRYLLRCVVLFLGIEHYTVDSNASQPGRTPGRAERVRRPPPPLRYAIRRVGPDRTQKRFPTFRPAPRETGQRAGRQ